jgi:hypothetical protein
MGGVYDNTGLKQPVEDYIRETDRSSRLSVVKDDYDRLFQAQVSLSHRLAFDSTAFLLNLRKMPQGEGLPVQYCRPRESAPITVASSLLPPQSHTSRHSIQNCSHGCLAWQGGAHGCHRRAAPGDFTHGRVSVPWQHVEGHHGGLDELESEFPPVIAVNSVPHPPVACAVMPTVALWSEQIVANSCTVALFFPEGGQASRPDTLLDSGQTRPGPGQTRPGPGQAQAMARAMRPLPDPIK